MRTSASPGSAGAMVAVSIIFTLLGLAIASVGGALAGLQQYRLNTYEPISARIVSARVIVRSGRHGQTFSPDIGYVYSVNGRSYQSHRVFPAGNATDPGERASDIVRGYHRGQITTAWRSPSDPASAFLIREGKTGPYTICLIPGVFFVFGLNMLFNAISLRRAQRPPVADGSGWFRLFEEGTLRARLRIAGGTSLLWYGYFAAVIVDCFFVRGRHFDSFLQIVSAIAAVLGLIWLVPVWRNWRLCRDFRNADVRISPPQIQPGNALQIRVRQEILRPIKIMELTLGLLCIRNDYVPGGSKPRLSSTEEWSQWKMLSAPGRYGAGSVIDAQDRIEVPATAMATSPPGQKDYPRFRWQIVMRIISEGEPAMRARFPIRVEQAAR